MIGHASIPKRRSMIRDAFIWMMNYALLSSWKRVQMYTSVCTCLSHPCVLLFVDIVTSILQEKKYNITPFFVILVWCD